MVYGNSEWGDSAGSGGNSENGIPDGGNGDGGDGGHVSITIKKIYSGNEAQIE